jgi:2-(1,2-epoxy-1,2-dihydrophenyl)acetyl-CoA isomerase
MMEPSRVRFEYRSDVAQLTFCSPQRRNALDPQWLREFLAGVEACAAAGPRAVLIDAEGPVFTAGGDLRHLAERLAELESTLEEMVRPFHAALAILAELDAPLVVAVQGPVVGGSTGLLWVADFVLAAPRARIIPGFPSIATSGDGGGSWWLPRLVGPRRALQLLMEGRELDAAEALDWGLVSEVVPAEALGERARDFAEQLATGPTVAYAQVKRLVRESRDGGFAEHLARETDAVLACARSEDNREGISSVLDRRPPKFAGR